MGKTFEKKLADEFVGKPCVIRSANAGVFIGIPTAITVKNGSGHLVATFEEVRRAWRWEVNQGISCSDMARFGLKESGTRMNAAVKAVIGNICEINVMDADAFTAAMAFPVDSAGN